MPRAAAPQTNAAYATVWKFVSYGLPEAPIILAALIYTHAKWLESLLAPLAPFYPYAVFGAGVLLGWRFHRSRLLFALLVLALADRTLLHLATGHALTRDHVVFQSIAVLLPLNFAALALTAERGFLTPPGLVRRENASYRSVLSAKQRARSYARTGPNMRRFIAALIGASLLLSLPLASHAGVVADEGYMLDSITASGRTTMRFFAPPSAWTRLPKWAPRS